MVAVWNVQLGLTENSEMTVYMIDKNTPLNMTVSSLILSLLHSGAQCRVRWHSRVLWPPQPCMDEMQKYEVHIDVPHNIWKWQITCELVILCNLSLSLFFLVWLCMWVCSNLIFRSIYIQVQIGVCVCVCVCLCMCACILYCHTCLCVHPHLIICCHGCVNVLPVPWIYCMPCVCVCVCCDLLPSIVNTISKVAYGGKHQNMLTLQEITQHKNSTTAS